MLAEMPDELFREWMAYDQVEPIGQDASHRLLALSVSAASWGKATPQQIAPWLYPEDEDMTITASPLEVMAAAQAAMRS